jgi:TonB family protein
MLRRLAPLALVSFVLGCGAAPPPSAATAPSATEAAPLPGDPKPPSAQAAPMAAPSAAPHDPATTPKPPPVGRAAVASTDAPLTSNITQDEVINQVGKSSDFNRCYTLGAAASRSWRAKVTVKATVGPTGNVGAVEVLSSTAKNPKVDACVLEGFKKLSFPRPAGAGTTTFTFPLSFDGIEQVQ